jgi:hypothetical protein
MKNKLIFQAFNFFIVCALIIILSGFLGTGLFWGIKTAFGYGGGGGGGGGGSNPQTNININTNVNQIIEILAPTVENVPSSTSSANLILKGTKATGTTVYINNSSSNITYPTETTWQSTQILSPGLNVFNILAKNNSGQSSSTVLIFVTLSNSGDITGDKVIDDLDLAKLVSNWGRNWPNGDFNKDGIIDDLDLALLVSHWSF